MVILALIGLQRSHLLDCSLLTPCGHRQKLTGIWMNSSEKYSFFSLSIWHPTVQQVTYKDPEKHSKPHVEWGAHLPRPNRGGHATQDPQVGDSLRSHTPLHQLHLLSVETFMTIINFFFSFKSISTGSLSAMRTSLGTTSLLGKLGWRWRSWRWIKRRTSMSAWRESHLWVRRSKNQTTLVLLASVSYWPCCDLVPPHRPREPRQPEEPEG